MDLFTSSSDAESTPSRYECEYGGGGDCENDATYHIVPLGDTPITAWQANACDEHLGVTIAVALEMGSEASGQEITRAILERIGG